MASANKTTNGLNLWSRSDIPEMADFNADNQIIDAAITKAENPLDQIGEGGIPAEYLAAGATGFGSVIARNESTQETPLVPSKAGAPLYVFGGDHIKVINWSQGDTYQQLCIQGENLINYYKSVSDGVNTTVNSINQEGIYAVKPGSDGGTMPEKISNTALVFLFKPNDVSNFSQIWIGAGIYRREKTGNVWGDWYSLTDRAESGDTAVRPAAPAAGSCYFDTTLGRPIWWNAVAGKWVDAGGQSV